MTRDAPHNLFKIQRLFLVTINIPSSGARHGAYLDSVTPLALIFLASAHMAFFLASAHGRGGTWIIKGFKDFFNLHVYLSSCIKTDIY